MIWTAQVNVGGSTGTRYAPVWIGRSLVTSTLADVQGRQPAAGTFRNLRVRLTSALTGSQTIVIALYVNSVATGLTVTLNSSTQEATDTTHSVGVLLNDQIAWRSVTTDSPSFVDSQFSFEFVPATANVSCYGFGGDVQIGSLPRRDGLLFGSPADAISWTDDTVEVMDVIALAGTITTLYVQLSATPPASTSRTFIIHKNTGAGWVAQDGSGGTPNTTVTISPGATTGSASFSLSVAAGDRVRIRQTGTGSPTTTHRAIGTVAFTSNTTGQWMYGGNQVFPPSGTLTTYVDPLGSGQSTPTTETANQHKNGPVSFSLSGMRVAAADAPTAGDSYAYMLRRNGADTTQEVILSDSETADVTTGAAVSVAAGDLLAIEIDPTGTPDIPDTFAWCFVAGAASSKMGCFVAGVNTTVTATRSAAFGLNGATNVQSNSGELCVFGNLRVTGSTNLAAGSTNLSAQLDALGT